MNKFYHKPKKVLPGVFLDHETGKLKIYGQSCPINADEFYAPIMEWFDNYLENPQKSTVLEISLSYFNTVSAKIIMIILKKMETLSEKGKKVKIRWFYHKHDEDLQDAGEDFETIIDVEFEFVIIGNKDEELKGLEGPDHLIDEI